MTMLILLILMVPFNLTTNVETITTITQSLYPIELNNSYQDLGDVVLPLIGYVPRIYQRKIKKQRTLTIHHFAGSWLPLKEKVIKWMQNHYLGFGVKLVVKSNQFLGEKMKTITITTPHITELM